MKIPNGILLGGLCLMLASTVAQADILCVRNKTKANKKSGAVALAKSFKTVATGSSCPKGFVALVDTQLFKGEKGDTGATGAQGIPGTNGKVDLGSCRSEVATFSSCPEGSVCSNTFQCGDANTSFSEAGDYVISYSWELDNGAAYIVGKDTILVGAGPARYPTGVTISSTSEQGFGPHTPSIGMVCCLPN